jgi:hypothetical protein
MCSAASSMSITRSQHDESGFPRPTGQRQALLTLVQMRQQDLEPRRELITDLHRYAHARIPHQPALKPKTTPYFFTAS